MKIERMMDGLFYDRFNGETVDRLPCNNVIFGRWLVRAPTGNDVFMNSVPVKSGAFLVPELSGRWRVLIGAGSIQRGKTSRYVYPEEIEADSIQRIGKSLDDVIEHNGTWLDWLDVVPLVPGMSDAVDLQPLENKIKNLFGHLETVCMRPKAHLRVEVDRLVVTKARRIPHKASSYLASHTEDWERPLVRGVLPKRILAEMRHDQIDIYENRVAARLVDHLVAYLGKRILEIRKMIKVFQDKEDYSDIMEGTYLRQERIAKLWGQSIEANEGLKRAKTTLSELERLKYRLMGLMDSPMYRAIPHRTYVASTLRTTNILVNDQNYRRVAELWRDWLDAGCAETKTPTDINRDAQDLCHGMVKFSMLLVMRALDQLGYEIREEYLESPLKRQGRWAFGGHGIDPICEWDEEGRIRIITETGSKKGSLAIIAIPVDLGAALKDEQVQEVLDQIVKAARKKEGRILVLYLGNPESSQSRLTDQTRCRIYTVGNDPGARMLEGLGFLPVSAWDIGSVERVCRALRWFLGSTRYEVYPMTIEVAHEARGIIDTNATDSWLESREEGAKLTIRRPPREFEWKRLKIEELAQAAGKKHNDAVKKHERLSELLREAKQKSNAGSLNRQKKDAYQETVKTNKQKKAVEELLQNLKLGCKLANALLVCPACGTVADPVEEFTVRENDCFFCNCKNCKTQWALRLCKNGHRYAVMLPGDFIDADDSSCGWEDRIYGSDLLALPRRTSDGSWGFLCPICGEIS